MKGIKFLALTLASITVYGITFSALASPSVPDGWYVEGNLGSSRANNVDYGSNTSANSSGFGWNVNGGYKFLPYFGAEAGYTQYAQNDVTSSGIKVANVSHYSYDLAGRAILPVGDYGFELFGKLGVARAHSHVANSASVPGVVVSYTGTNNNTCAYFGLGADYNFIPSLAAVVQWNRARASNSIGNLDLYSIGLQYIFD